MPTAVTGPTVVTTSLPVVSQKARVQVKLAQNVNLESITNIIKTIGGRYGCLTCGLGGVDLQLSGDRLEAVEFSKLAGVESVSVE